VSNFIELSGVDETTRALSQFRRKVQRETEATLSEAAEYFVERAVKYAPEDEGNLKDAIGVLSERGAGVMGSLAAMFNIGNVRQGQVRVGVDLKHTPATRADKVGQYAVPMEIMFGYIDRAQRDTDRYLNSKMNAMVRDAIGDFARATARVLRSSARTIMSTLKGFFGR
jgi:hypothetical protein